MLDADEAFSGADFKLDGAPLTQVTVVGQVRSVTPQSTNVTVRIDDGTGQMDVKKWIDADRPPEAEAPLELDSYVRVWGRLKSFSSKRHVGAHVMRPVADFNEVNYHLLEATYVHLYLTRGPLGPDGGAPAPASTRPCHGIFVDGPDSYPPAEATAGYGGKLTDCSPAARKMYDFIKQSHGGNEGIHLNIISASTGLSVREVLSTADELLGRGIIYPTVDDETWAILELA